jgi:hypothetical protein
LVIAKDSEAYEFVDHLCYFFVSIVWANSDEHQHSALDLPNNATGY